MIFVNKKISSHITSFVPIALEKIFLLATKPSTHTKNKKNISHLQHVLHA